MPEAPQRKLAAIMFTDLVDYLSRNPPFRRLPKPLRKSR